MVLRLMRREVGSPLQGLMNMGAVNPGRCPGLVWGCAVGAKNRENPDAARAIGAENRENPDEARVIIFSKGPKARPHTSLGQRPRTGAHKHTEG